MLSSSLYTYRSVGSVRSVRSLGLVALLLAATSAQAVAPSLAQIAPRGGQRGTELPVVFSGSNLADAAGIVFHEPGITVKDIVAESANVTKATLVIAPDCAVGTHALRLQTKTGISGLQLFSVGTLKEILETEPNNDLAAAPAIELNTTINGVTNLEDVDYFSVDLAAGGRLAVEVEGLRLGRTLYDPKLRLFDPTGIELIAEDDTQLLKQDAGFVYTATAAGKYTVALSDASYGGSGDCDYRLHIGTFPRPFAGVPMGGAPGSAVEVSWLGDPGLAKQSVVVPTVALGTQPLAAQTDLGVAPTNMPFRVSTLPGVLEVEPNNDAATGTPAAIPGAFDGIIETEGDQDFYKFEGTAGQVVEFRVWARAMGSPLDSVMHLISPAGTYVVGDDDAAAIDASMRVTLAETGAYSLYIHDHLKRGGPTFAYRIEVSPVVAKLAMKLAENLPAQITVPQGNQSYLLVNASRADFDAPIKVNMVDLPAGLTPAAEVLPAGQTTVPVLITAAADAPVTASLARIQGQQDVPENPILGELDHEVRLITGANDTTFFGRTVDRVAVAVSEPAPFNVEIVTLKTPIVQGGYRNLMIKATRKEGFKDPIDLRFPWVPPGMGPGTAQVPAEQNQVEIRIEVSRGVAPGKYKMFVAATAAGYVLCTPFTDIEVQEPWVNFDIAPAETEQGKPVEMIVQLQQKTPFEGTFEATLQGLPKGVTSTPQTFTQGSIELKFPLTVAADAAVGKHESVFITTTITAQEEPVNHVSLAKLLQIYEPLPATLAAAPPPPVADPAAPPAPARKTRFPTS